MSDIKERFGRYYILDHLVNGGMAQICRARFLGEQADRIVAIKMIQPQFSADESFKQMFMDEIKVTFGLLHPNIVQTYDYGIHKDQLYVAMEYCDGRNLKEYLNRLRNKKFVFPVEISVYIMSQVCQGLHYAHRFTDKLTGKEARIIHRDISPHNIMLTYDGAVKVIDFGIAKADTNTESTQAGTIKGKLSYLAPEYLEGLELDPRYDIFSVGITLWEMLCSQKLFKAKNDLAVLKKIQECKIPLPSSINPNVPKELDEIVLKALHKDRNKRYEDMDQLNRALIKFLYANFPDFNASDLRYFAKELFKEEIKKDREKLFEYGKIDLKPHIEAWKKESEGPIDDESSSTMITESRQGKAKVKMFDFGFDEDKKTRIANKGQGHGIDNLTLSSAIKKTDISLTVSKSGTSKRNRRSNGFGEEDASLFNDNENSQELEENNGKRKVLIYVASIAVLAFVFNGRIRQLFLKPEVAEQEYVDTDLGEAADSIVKTIRLKNYNREKHKVFIDGKRVKPSYLKELTIDDSLSKVLLRVERLGRKHYIKELSFDNVDYYNVEIPDGEKVDFGYIYVSKGCQMEGKIFFDLWGENRSEVIPHRNKLGISFPIKGDGRYPASDFGNAEYTIYFQKKGETLERKLEFSFDKAGQRIDLCDL